MRTKLSLVLCLAVLNLLIVAPHGLALAGTEALHTHKAPEAAGAKFAPGEVLVKFKNPPAARPDLAAKERFRPLSGAKAAAYLAALPAKAQKALEKVKGKVERVHPHMGLLKVKLPKTAKVGQTIEDLHRSGAVEYAEPNYLIEPQAAVPNDPFFAQQWSLNNLITDADIDAPEAWGYATDGSKTVVAIIDSGVDYRHPDLNNVFWTNAKEAIGNPGVDDDSNAWVDDIYGINTAFPSTVPSTDPRRGDPMDDYGHGTALAGVIGALGNNNIGICGINWTAQIMALKFLNSSGTGKVEDAITCMNYAMVNKGIPGNPDYIERMIMVLGWKQSPSTFSSSFYDALRIAQDAGVLVITAAGNDDADNDIFPCYPGTYDLPNMICAGASDASDRKINLVTTPSYKGSNYGFSGVDLFAPGKDILSTYKKGTSPTYDTAYRSYTGTSMAAAHVAGAAALVWSQYPDQDWKQIKGLLLNGVEDGLAKDFRAICLTEGRLNLNNSLGLGLAPHPPAIFSVVPSQAQAGDIITVTGVNLGTTGTVTFQDKIFPPDSIMSWEHGSDFDRIKIKIPSTGIPRGIARLKVTNAKGTSRGAAFANISKEAVVGHLILERGHAAGAQVGSDFYVMGGNCCYGLTGHVEKFSLATKHTVIDSDWMMPTPVSNAGAAAIGNRIYVVGGLANGVLVDKVQILDTTNMTWSTGPPLPKPLMQTAVASLNGKLYVLGGLDKITSSALALNTTYVHDPANSTTPWEAGASMLQPAAYAAAAPYGTAKIWVMGGFTKNALGTQQRTVQEYDPGKDKWTERAHLVRPRAGAGGVNNSTKVYCLHGTVVPPTATSKYDGYDDGEWYNPTLGYWMPSIVRYFGPYVKTWVGNYTPGAGQYLNKIYILGGATGTAPDPYKFGFSNNVWSFTRP
jgi:subtilisin family serine protease